MHRKYPVAPQHVRTLDTDIELLGYHIPAKVIYKCCFLVWNFSIC